MTNEWLAAHKPLVLAGASIFFGACGMFELKVLKNRELARLTWVYGAFVVIGGAVFCLFQ